MVTSSDERLKEERGFKKAEKKNKNKKTEEKMKNNLRERERGWWCLLGHACQKRNKFGPTVGRCDWATYGHHKRPYHVWYDEWVSDAMKGWDCMLGFNRSTSYQLYVSGGARDGDGQPARD